MITIQRTRPRHALSAQSALDFPLELCPELTRFQGSYLEILQNQTEFCKDINSRSELSAWEGTTRCADRSRSSCFWRLEEAINRVPPDCQSTWNSNTEQIRNGSEFLGAFVQYPGTSGIPCMLYFSIRTLPRWMGQHRGIRCVAHICQHTLKCVVSGVLAVRALFCLAGCKRAYRRITCFILYWCSWGFWQVYPPKKREKKHGWRPGVLMLLLRANKTLGFHLLWRLSRCNR